MKNRLFQVILPVILALLAGCATAPPKPKEPPAPPTAIAPPPVQEKDPFSELAEVYRLKGREAEQKGDLPKVLRHWEVIHTFAPDDAEAIEKIARLKKQIAADAEGHFQKGLALFQRRSFAPARKEFLLALYLKPDHAEALKFLKEKMAGEDAILYEVKKGDTIRGIANRIYKDPQKDFLVATFNGLKTDARIEPPLTLRLPILESRPAKRASGRGKPGAEPTPETAAAAKEILGKARAAFNEGRYQESASLAEKILEYDPENKENHHLLNASFYHWGKQLSQEGRYDEALKAFGRVDPGYKDVNHRLASNRKQGAETHYKKGVKFFIEEEIEKAIQEWESTLAMEPQHPKAKKDIETGRKVLQKLEKIK